MRARRSPRSASGVSIVNGRIVALPADFSAMTAMWLLTWWLWRRPVEVLRPYTDRVPEPGSPASPRFQATEHPAPQATVGGLVENPQIAGIQHASASRGPKLDCIRYRAKAAGTDPGLRLALADLEEGLVALHLALGA